MANKNLEDRHLMISAGHPVPLSAFLSFAVRVVRSRPRLCGVYFIRCAPTGLVYIGSSIDAIRRWSQHARALRGGWHHSEKLQRSFNKYGAGAFMLRFVEASNAADLHITENRFIQTHFDLLLNVSTVAECAMGGRSHSDDTRGRMSAARKGKQFSAEWRANMSAARKGVAVRGHGWAHSDATREKIAASHRGRLGTMLGRRHSESAKGRISAALRKADHSRKRRGSNHPGARAVVIDGECYQTMRDAAKALGVFEQTVRKRVAVGMGRYVDDPHGRQTKAWGLEDKRGPNHKNARAVIVDDLRFKCCKDAAAHFGIHPSSFAEWIQKGRARYADGLPPMRIGPRPKDRSENASRV